LQVGSWKSVVLCVRKLQLKAANQPEQELLDEEAEEHPPLEAFTRQRN
jgi:hypothetical protein